jgi:proline iminopeptidase
MTHFFPETKARRAGDLPVGDGHTLYWEQCGSANGTPLLFLHGGPGSGCSAKFRRLFDPRRFDVTLFDQRGAGRSSPHLSLTENTTGDLIDDIEALRHKLEIDEWIVFGPSWGSTLALAYAEAFPERVKALVVEAVFLGTRKELDWWHDPAGAPRFFPEAWADFIDPVPEKERHSPRSILEWCFGDMQRERNEKFVTLNRLGDAKASLGELRKSTLYRWTEYEDRLSYLEKSAADVRTDLAERGTAFVAAHSMIEAHYFLNDCFLEPNQLLDHARQLANTPMRILHSRYDMVCPAEAAVKLHRACPHAKLKMVTLNGHGMTETVQAELNEIMTQLLEEFR